MDLKKYRYYFINKMLDKIKPNEITTTSTLYLKTTCILIIRTELKPIFFRL